MSLDEIAEAMESADDLCTFYLHRKNGELVMVTDEDAEHVESGNADELLPDWQRDIIPKVREILSSTDYIVLPHLTGSESYSIMEQFCSSIEQPALRDEFSELIRGRAAFQRFKDAIHVHEIAEHWYKFRRDQLKELAKDFLSSEGISCSDQT